MASLNIGCQTCKTRRIKCDRTKPTCQRCQKSKRICVEAGAATQAQFSIHDENSFASGKLKRPRGPRSSLTVLCPQYDLQTRALSYYLQFHLQTPKDVPKISGGLSECISAWALSGRMGTCQMVDLALSSMALAVYSRTQHSPPAAAEAASKYNRLLRVAQLVIAQLTAKPVEEKAVDSCLLAVSLMGRYENVNHLGEITWKQNFWTLPSWSHTDGSMAIMKVWFDKLNSRNSTTIIKHTRRGLIKACLLRGLPLPAWMMDGEQFGECDDELFCDRVLVRIVGIHRKIKILRKRGGLETMLAEELNSEIQELDSNLKEWSLRIPTRCAFQRHDCHLGPGSWPQKHFYSSVVYTYPQPSNAAAWCYYFGMAMILHVTQLRILDLIHLSPQPPADFNYERERLECCIKLDTVASNLACSIPFCLERFKVNPASSPNSEASIALNTDGEIKPYLASLAAWPLSIGASLEGIDAKQQKWFRSELGILGRITGDATLECAESGRWVIL